MTQLERRQKILNLLEEHSSLSVKEISATLYFSESSVRRDVKELVARNLVSHLYGGVFLDRHTNQVVPLSIRDESKSQAKETVAKAAAALVKDGDVLIMDSSSTVRRVIHYLSDRKNLRIITNNLLILEEPLPDSFRLYCTGGEYSAENKNFSGSGAKEYLKSVRADLLFFSSQGISESGDITDVSEESTSLRKLMIERAKKSYFLCDSSKIGVEKQFVVCNLSEIDGILCEDTEKAERIRKAGQTE